MAELLHFEDFPVGEVVRFGRYEVTAEEIKAFAREFDWHPFHIDEAAAADSAMGGLCASGWHLCAMFMRMIYDGYVCRSASMGSFGVEEVKWLKPVRPSHVLSIQRTTLDARVSAKRPEMGIVTFEWEVLDQVGEKLAEMRGVNLFRTRSARGGDAA